MSDIEHRHLRSALEFAVLIAAEGQKRRPPLAFPKELKQFLAKPRLPTGALGRVRRIVEAAPDFRSALAGGALPEMVDEVGRLWLDGESDWERRASDIIEADASESEFRDLRRDLKRSEKRRAAAEQAAARIQAEVLVRDQTIDAQIAELDEVRADVVKANEELAEVRTELIDTRNELRHARDRQRAAVQRADAASNDMGAPDGAVGAGSSRPATDELAAAEASASAAKERLSNARDASHAFAAELERLLAADGPTGSASSDAGVGQDGSARRAPIRLPGGVISTSAEAAEHLVRSDAAIMIDGYNVAKLGWPDRSLEAQRDALINRAENLARRHGADLTIVFDGASVVGAHAAQRRTIRVVYSPDGVTADDVIRSEVARLPFDRPVVVVTNDREIVDDVRRAGANVVPSNAFVATL